MSRLWSSPRRKIASVAAALLVVGGTALAAWLVTSSGSGTGHIGSLTAPTVSAVGTFTGTDLFPGSSGDLQVSITNPNGALVVTGLSPNGNVSGLSGPCASATLNGQAVDVPNQPSGLSIPVPAGSSTVTLKDVVNLRSQAPTDCQGQTFSAPITLTFSTP